MTPGNRVAMWIRADYRGALPSLRPYPPTLPAGMHWFFMLGSHQRQYELERI